MPQDSGGFGGFDASPVHYSKENGVHADFGAPPEKVHIPFVGQTTLQTFRIGGRPSLENDRILLDLGGALKLPDGF